MRAALLALVCLTGCSLIDATSSASDPDGGPAADCVDQECFQVVESETEVPSPSLVAVGQLHGDTRPDVVVVDRTDSTLEVMENVAGGALETTGTIEAGGVSWLAIGDFVEDAGNEVLLLDAADQRLVMIAITSDNGGPYTVNTTDLADPSALIAVGDYDEDELDDVAVLYPAFGTDGLQIRLSRGDGLFNVAEAGAVFSPPAESAPLLSSDFDNDGHLDLLTMHAGDIKLFRGHGDGTFDDLLVVGAFDSPILGAGAFDLTDDQLPELVLASGGGTGRVSFVENESTEGIGEDSFVSAFEEFEIVSESVAVGDFEGDALRDVVAFNVERLGNLPDAYLLRALGGEGYDTSVWLFMDDPIGAGAVGDLDADGRSDLVAAVPGLARVRVYLSHLTPPR